MRGTEADRLGVAVKPGNAGGATGTGHLGLLGGQLPAGGMSPVSEPKPGVDEESIQAFEANLKANLYKWLKTHPRFHLHFTPTSSSWCQGRSKTRPFVPIEK